MRLNRYINEEKTDIDKIIKECRPFIKDLQKCSSIRFLYRGYESSDFIIKKKVRKNRKPTDTLPDVQKLLDSMFYKHIKVKPRSNGVFTTSYEPHTRHYGNTYIFLPIGDYRIVWSPKIEDLYADVIASWQSEYLEAANEDLKELEERLQNIVNTYIIGKLCGALSTSCEVMVLCENYYLLDSDRFEYDLKKKLLV